MSTLTTPISLIVLAGFFASSSGRSLDVRKPDSEWSLDCGTMTTAAGLYGSVIEIQLLSIDWASVDQSCNRNSSELRHLLLFRCHGNARCSWSRRAFNGENACPMKVNYTCVPQVKTTEPANTISLRKVVNDESDRWRYYSLSCEFNGYVLDVNSVNYAPSVSLNSTCSLQRPSNYMKFLSDICPDGVHRSCQWVADEEDDDKKCPLEVSYTCNKFTPTTTVKTPDITSMIGCSLANTWSFGCYSNMPTSVTNVTVEPAHCLSLPCSAEIATKIQDLLNYRCYHRSSCSLDLYEMNSWGIKCAARVHYACADGYPATEMTHTIQASSADPNAFSYSIMLFSSLLTISRIVLP